MLKLIVSRPGQPDETLFVEQRTVVVGAARDCAVRLPESSSPPRAVEIRLTLDGSLVIKVLDASQPVTLGSRTLAAGKGYRQPAPPPPKVLRLKLGVGDCKILIEVAVQPGAASADRGLDELERAPAKQKLKAAFKSPASGELDVPAGASKADASVDVSADVGAAPADERLNTWFSVPQKSAPAGLGQFGITRDKDGIAVAADESDAPMMMGGDAPEEPAPAEEDAGEEDALGGWAPQEEARTRRAMPARREAEEAKKEGVWADDGEALDDLIAQPAATTDAAPPPPPAPPAAIPPAKPRADAGFETGRLAEPPGGGGAAAPTTEATRVMPIGAAAAVAPAHAVGSGKRASGAPAVISRRTTARYHKQMNPARNFPLMVVFSRDQIAPMRDARREVGQVEADRRTVVTEENPVVTVIPRFPGCLCVPDRVDVDLTPDLAKVHFSITPTATGDLGARQHSAAMAAMQSGQPVPDGVAHVEVQYDGRVINRIPTPARVTTTRWARVSATLGVAMPFFFGTLDVIGPGESNAYVLAKALEWAGSLDVLPGKDLGPHWTLGFIIGAGLLVIGGLFWLVTKPKRGRPVESFLHVETRS